MDTWSFGTAANPPHSMIWQGSVHRWTFHPYLHTPFSIADSRQRSSLHTSRQERVELHRMRYFQLCHLIRNLFLAHMTCNQTPANQPAVAVAVAINKAPWGISRPKKQTLFLRVRPNTVVVFSSIRVNAVVDFPSLSHHWSLPSCQASEQASEPSNMPTPHPPQ